MHGKCFSANLHSFKFATLMIVARQITLKKDKNAPYFFDGGKKGKNKNLHTGATMKWRSLCLIFYLENGIVI